MFNIFLRRSNDVPRRFITTKTTSSTVRSILKLNKPGDVVEVKGWIKSMRNQKENVFIDVGDGSTDTKLQIFVPQKFTPPGLSTGSSVIASGSLNLSPRNHIELHADCVKVCGECVISEGYPFAPRKQYAPEYIRQHLNFRPRTNKFSALLRIRSAATLAINQHLTSEGYFNVHTPILTSNDCEGAGEVFKVIPECSKVIKAMIKKDQSEDEAYFNTKAYLTVSGQLHLEAAAHGLGKVYSFGPTFRAENSRSRLHLSEFYMLEAEIAFVERIEEIINCIENLLKRVTASVLDSNLEDVERCREDKLEINWLDKEFPIISYNEAVKILEDNEDKYQGKFSKSEGFSKEHEIFLVQYCGGSPVFVINWPKEIKPFYMKQNADGTVAALDLLSPNVGEVVGGSLREDNLLKLESKLPENHNLGWYLDLRKFGGVPTGGFGLGFERYLQFILGISNIKDTVPFPRWPHNCDM